MPGRADDYAQASIAVLAGAILALSAALAAGCGTPFHVSDATLRLWLQLWDAQTGHLLWESTGEVTVAAAVVRQDSTVSLE